MLLDSNDFLLNSAGLLKNPKVLPVYRVFGQNSANSIYGITLPVSLELRRNSPNFACRSFQTDPQA